jgi:hypothetical protein
MDHIKKAFQNPVLGAGVPIGSAAIAEICNNLIPIFTIMSLTVGILVGLTSIYLNIKKSRKS